MTVKEADRLIKKYVKLREQVKISDESKLITEFKKHESICVNKFKYLVLMKTARYKNFNNYDDLIQEGLVALLKAMNSYNPSKGSWFWWAHKYLDTSIARCANLHTTIRFPLQYAKHNTPHREAALPLLIDYRENAHEIMENGEALGLLKSNIKHLSSDQKQIIQMLFGINNEKIYSIANICKQLKIPRSSCIKVLNTAIGILKKNTNV